MGRDYTLGELAHEELKDVTPAVEDLKVLVHQLYMHFGLRMESWPDKKPIVLFDEDHAQTALAQWKTNGDWLPERGFTREGWLQRSGAERSQIIEAWIESLSHPREPGIMLKKGDPLSIPYDESRLGSA